MDESLTSDEVDYWLFVSVSNGLGVGFLEKVYENALAHELRKAGVAVEQQKEIPVRYDDVIVGQYIADLLVGGPRDCRAEGDQSLRRHSLSPSASTTSRQPASRVCLLMNFGQPRVKSNVLCFSRELCPSYFICVHLCSSVANSFSFLFIPMQVRAHRHHHHRAEAGRELCGRHAGVAHRFHRASVPRGVVAVRARQPGAGRGARDAARGLPGRRHPGRGPRG